MKSSVLLIQCRDRKGLIHEVTGILAGRGLNIEANGEFVDSATQGFFMRTEYSGRTDGHALVSALKGILPPDARVEIVEPRRKRVVVLVTRESHCLGDLLVRREFGDLNAEILAVVGNYPDLEAFTGKFSVPFHVVSHEGVSREAHEAKILETVSRYPFDYLVLAKYMRILSPGFVARFSRRMINIHHSFLPAFKGAAPYQQAYERGVKVIGATAHFVDDRLDGGPIIAQATLPVDHTQDAQDMALAGRDVEKSVLARALKLVFEDRVFVSGNKTVIF